MNHTYSSNQTILWAQNESTDIPPTVLVDSKRVEGDESQYAFAELCSANQELKLSEKIREKLYQKGQRNGKFFAHQANYAILPNKKGVYLQGCYLDEDERGRRMPYMFLCKDTDNMKTALDKLKDVSAILNRRCNEYELNLIRIMAKPSFIPKFNNAIKKKQ